MINPPHILTAQQQREILKEERERDRVYCRGDMVRYAELVRDLDFLNRQFYASHGYCFHSQGTKPYKQACITNGECRKGRDKLLDTNQERENGSR